MPEPMNLSASIVLNAAWAVESDYVRHRLAQLVALSCERYLRPLPRWGDVTFEVRSQRKWGSDDWFVMMSWVS